MESLLEFLTSSYRFLQTYDTSLGIYIREKEAVLIQIRKNLKGYQVLKNITIPYQHLQEVLTVIIDIIEKHQLKSNYTVVNIQRQGALLKTISIPLIEAEDIQAFLYQNSELFLPPGLDIQNVQLHSKVIDIKEDKVQLLILIYRKEMIEEYLNELAPLEPLQVIYSGFNLANPVLHKKADFSGIILEVDHSEIFVMSFYKGTLIGHQIIANQGKIEYPEKTFLIDKLRSIAEEAGEQMPEWKYWICGESSQTDWIEICLDDQGGIAYQEKTALESPLYRHAFALAINPFLEMEEEFDVNSEEIQLTGIQNYYKQLTTKSILFMGTIILGLALLLMGGQAVLNWQYNQYESELLRIAPLLTTSDSLHVKQKILRQTWNNSTSLAQQRTHFAFYLYKITGILPEKVWFHKIYVTRNKSGKISIRLNGFSLKEKRIAQYLKKLEKLPFAKNIALDEMTLYTGKEVYRKWKLSYRKITYFRMRLAVSNG